MKIIDGLIFSFCVVGALAGHFLLAPPPKSGTKLRVSFCVVAEVLVFSHITVHQPLRTKRLFPIAVFGIIGVVLGKTLPGGQAS